SPSQRWPSVVSAWKSPRVHCADGRGICSASQRSLTCAVSIGIDRFNEAGQVLFGRRVCYFGSHVRVAASRTNEFLVKGPKIDLLFGLPTGASIGHTRANF